MEKLGKLFIKVKPQLHLPTHDSTSSPFKEISISSQSSIDKQNQVGIMRPSCTNWSIDDGTLQLNYKQGSFNKKMMNRYFSFGAQGQALEDADKCTMSNGSHKLFSSLVAQMLLSLSERIYCHRCCNC